MKRTGLDGQGACARACVAMKGVATPSATAWRRVIIVIVPPDIVLADTIISGVGRH